MGQARCLQTVAPQFQSGPVPTLLTPLSLLLFLRKNLPPLSEIFPYISTVIRHRWNCLPPNPSTPPPPPSPAPPPPPAAAEVKPSAKQLLEENPILQYLSLICEPQSFDQIVMGASMIPRTNLFAPIVLLVLLVASGVQLHACTTIMGSKYSK